MSQAAIILVVDDKSSNRETIRELLDGDDFRIVEASDGETALLLAAENPPDLVFLDVMMPGMDGFEVCRRLRSDPKLAEVPVIMVTALDDQASRLAGLKAGADDFITKPYYRAELQARARTITRLNRYRRLHEAQTALQNSERHFRALFDLGPVAIYTCDASGAVRDFNRRAVELWGRRPEPGKEMYCGSYQIFSPAGVPIPLDSCPMADVISGRLLRVTDVEIMIARPDGSRRSAIVNIAPLVDERGMVTGAINCFYDISERKAAEIELQANSQWLKAVYEQAAVGVLEISAKDGHFVRFNQRFCDLLGYSKEEFAQLSLSLITHKPDLATDLENLDKMRQGTLREYTREKRYCAKDGTLIWGSVAVSSIGPAEGPPDSFIAVVLDITERKRIDEHFLHAQKMEALGQFSGGVAHDFNNILTAIGGYTELSLMVLKENPAVRDHLGAVLRSTARAADLVKQILTFSRQESQARQTVDLRPVVAESLKLMRATIPTTIGFETSIAKDLPSVLANANQVHQVLMNLGINAWHAMRERQGRILISLEPFDVTSEYAATKPNLRAGPYVRLSVSDTGDGMDPKTLRRIFEPFFTTKQQGQGTGLGLSVVHGIMDSHDGAVTVHSQPGEGTVFRLYFPVHDGVAATTLAPFEKASRGNGERILIVDDEEILAQLMQKALVSLGYEAEYRTEPREALALLKEDTAGFRMLLTDQTMPGMTGLALAAEATAIQPSLQVVLMTGYSLSLTAERIEEAGIRQLLLKPVGIDSLGCCVHAAISGKPPTNNGSHSPYR
ncbi:MAG TPA: response regulator [Opitutaceae bacterium]|jgi:PAS domain S-box-containing protein|nr:response regulator [Opitutaceae bacterium]